MVSVKRKRSDATASEDEFSEVSELSFSRNYISLSISGPGVADLSFCDLPGVPYLSLTLWSSDEEL